MENLLADYPNIKNQGFQYNGEISAAEGGGLQELPDGRPYAERDLSFGAGYEAAVRGNGEHVFGLDAGDVCFAAS